MMCSLPSMDVHGFFGPAGLEHLEHAVGDEESAHDVAGGGDDRDRAEDRRQRALCRARQDDGADHRDGVERVGQRHQRRVQQGRDPPDHLKPDEPASMKT